MQAPKFPLIPEPLLKALDAAFPARCPDINWPERRVWMEAGKRAVVELLMARFKEQNHVQPVSPQNP
jgi:hypothetical protein